METVVPFSCLIKAVLILNGILTTHCNEVILTTLRNTVSLETTIYNNAHIMIDGNLTCQQDSNVTFKWVLEKLDCLGEFYKITVTDGYLTRWDNTTVKQKSHTSLCIKGSALQMPWQEEIHNGSKNVPQPHHDDDKYVVGTVDSGTGVYILHISVMLDNEGIGDIFTAYVSFVIKGPHGYLPAIIWPRLPFYGIMCGVYIIFGIMWLLMMACQWRDLLRIQYWIGAVIFIGMLEKAFFLAQYEHENSSGDLDSQTLVVFAEIVSSLKRSLSRVLVIIVSLGYGIVKPRLGSSLQKVIAVGVIYFGLAIVEGFLRQFGSRNQRYVQLADIPLSVVDAIICWWIFTSLIQTTRTLRLRRNVIKLTLYRHFTNTLIFSVLASLAFMIWTMSQHRFVQCIKSWRQMWVDDAFWHILYSCLLFMIMILWRPSANNQRFAFSPLLDAADDEDEDDEESKDAVMNDAFEGMKVRNMKTQTVQPKQSKNVDENLKWIEDNIPSGVADGALPSLLDSDEEVVTTRYEMSKME